MIFIVDVRNTGIFEDGFLRINTEKNELGYPDGTTFKIEKRDENENSLGEKVFDFKELFENS